MPSIVSFVPHFSSPNSFTIQFAHPLTSRHSFSSSPRLALSDPKHHSPSPPYSSQQRTSWSPIPPRPTNPSHEPDYHGWSRDFIDLCTSQFSLLASTIPKLTQALLFFRSENPNTGALEFIPLIAHSPSASTASRVWISSGSAGDTSLERGSPSRMLPGGIPAEWIIPDYPFKTTDRKGAIVMPDGGLCVPVEYNDVLAGSVVLYAESDPTPGWTDHDVDRAAMVAKTIALGAALEGKWNASVSTIDTSRKLIESMRVLLRVTLHQIRSPISALVTFGHLLLHKLPPGDRHRTLAKNIIVEALRVDDLLKPLDKASDDHALPAARSPWYEHPSGQLLNLGENEAQPDPQQLLYTDPLASSDNVSSDDLQLLWLSDVLEPQAEVAKALAEEKGMKFVVDIDDDLPAVLAIEKYVREAVSNLIDNSLKYSPAGAYIGLSCYARSTVDEEDMTDGEVVEVLVWDTGYGFKEEEKEEVFEFGLRGSAAERLGISGSGIGLSTVRKMLRAIGADVALESPIPEYLDPRVENELENVAKSPGSVFSLRFKRPSL